MPFPVQACLEAAAGSLQQLEQVAPGSCSRLLCEAMLQLSISSTPDLQTLKTAAASMFGSGSGTTAAAGGGGGGVVGSVQQQLGEGEGQPGTGQALQQQQGRSRSNGGLLSQGYGGAEEQQQQQQQQRPGMDCVVLQGVGPLGPLGSYLLARWREDVARSAAAAAQGMI